MFFLDNTSTRKAPACVQPAVTSCVTGHKAQLKAEGEEGMLPLWCEYQSEEQRVVRGGVTR